MLIKLEFDTAKLPTSYGCKEEWLGNLLDALRESKSEWLPVGVTAVPPDTERAKLEAALAKIKGGFIDSECLMSSPPDWKNAFGQLQDIAKTALPQPAESGATA